MLSRFLFPVLASDMRSASPSSYTSGAPSSAFSSFNDKDISLGPRLGGGGGGDDDAAADADEGDDDDDAPPAGALLSFCVNLSIDVGGAVVGASSFLSNGNSEMTDLTALCHTRQDTAIDGISHSDNSGNAVLQFEVPHLGSLLFSSTTSTILGCSGNISL